MRAFIVVCLCATVLAAPQGYNYQQQANSRPFAPQLTQTTSTATQQGGHNFLQQAFQTPKVQQTLLGNTVNFQPKQQQQQQPFQQPQQQYLAPQQQQQQQQPIGLPNFGVQQQQQQQQQFQQPQQQYLAPQPQPQQQQQLQQQYQQTPVITKDIYVHVAPEEPEERFTAPQAPLPPPRKHYRILFIKAPTPKISASALQIQQAQNEEKTIIYVLTKKPDPLDLQAAVQNVQQKAPSKPEVYFIKYKTAEEAQHAQRTIQEQYDQLGGTSQVSDEGVAPVTSVIGVLDQQTNTQGNTQSLQNFSSSGSTSNSGSSGGYTSTTSGSSANKYLPPIVRI